MFPMIGAPLITSNTNLHIRYRQWKKQILELFNMKVKKYWPNSHLQEKLRWSFRVFLYGLIFFYLSRRTSDRQISLVQQTFPLVPHNRTNVIVEAWFMLSFIFCGNMWSFYRLFIVYRYCCWRFSYQEGWVGTPQPD
jgi:hypothetical protein